MGHNQRPQILWYTVADGYKLVSVYSLPCNDLGLTRTVPLVIMVTYLQHTAPEVPHYRGNAWTFTRGAAATVDRDFLGWQGKFFFHGVAHYHIIHHVRLVVYNYDICNTDLYPPLVFPKNAVL